ncbi:xylose isomerase domain-containing protein [Corynebacterium suranareeae]|uniref:Xylose isomerase domain-containing protein n=1 Tax=Corynebacterium suranareeae TaxID=2506452 RepID=A0A160PUR5_9CORY|nr:sugar phosphate isomerase/epimerase [Corynebacterium suranareeae]BAU96891.1 xylose isomerase domain-containing protein [Corynebacterium suranareeae]
MFTITGFADEIAHDLDEQISLLSKLNINHVEFRSAWGTKILDLNEQQLTDAKSKLDAAGISLSAVGSDLGKINITDPFEDHLARATHGIEVAKFFNAKYIRMFSFFIPEGDNPEDYREEVLSRTRAMVELAEAGGIILLHENEKGIYGDSPQRVKDLVTSIDSPTYRAIYDAANYVQTGFKPFDEAWPLVKNYVDYVHVKDATIPDTDHPLGIIKPAGQGDGQYPELLSALNQQGYNGFVSIEPHLGDFDEFGGLCGPELWSSAHKALVEILDTLGADYD